jgi:phosphatidylserine decarboxylase
MFHKEGQKIILTALFITISIALAANVYIPVFWLKIAIQLFSLIALALILQFFRNPKRHFTIEDTKVKAPADGKIVIIEEVFEKEYFKSNRLQVSIFMSPLNVHVTRYPISGTITFSKYHPGKYLVAWHPKSSEKNERTTIVVKNETYGEVLYRQIAGALARRIVNYAEEGMQIVQGSDAGFIKFGSRIDVFLPVNAKIKVALHQKVKGGIDIISE